MQNGTGVYNLAYLLHPKERQMKYDLFRWGLFGRNGKETIDLISYGLLWDCAVSYIIGFPGNTEMWLGD